MHDMCVLCDLLRLTWVNEDGRGMSRTTLHEKLLAVYECGVEILRLKHTKYRSELLVCERLCL